MRFEKITRPRAHQCSLRVQSRTSGHHRPAIARNVFALDTQKPCVCSPGRQSITDLLCRKRLRVRHTKTLNPAAKINNCNALCTSRCISKRLPGLERISVARVCRPGRHRASTRVIAGNVFAFDTQEASYNSSLKINNCKDLSASLRPRAYQCPGSLAS